MAPDAPEMGRRRLGLGKHARPVGRQAGRLRSARRDRNWHPVVISVDAGDALASLSSLHCNVVA